MCPIADSVVAARFADGGAVLLGKLATHEFAIGGPSFDLPWPPARNPWNIEHITGGSSSGSAAAIAGGMLRMATGSDTGGSIRGPAAWCGLAGIKPTYGRVSRRGVFPLSWTLDHCGPLGCSVEDCAIALQVIAGHDAEDPASVDLPVPDFRADLERGVAGLRIGVPRDFFAHAKMVTPEVLGAIDRIVEVLRDGGARVEEVSLPDYGLFAAAGRVIMLAEALTIHQHDMQTRLLDYAEATAGRFVLGATIGATDYINALRVRRELTDAVEGALARYDALLTASALITAPQFDSVPDSLSLASPMQTIPFNVTGHPAMSVPVGLGADRLPLSVQVVGRPFDEAMLFRVGRMIEAAIGMGPRTAALTRPNGAQHAAHGNVKATAATEPAPDRFDRHIPWFEELDMAVRRIAGPVPVFATAGALFAVSGIAMAQTIVVAPTAPPPPQVETIPPPPAAVDVWTPGHWAWNGGTWAWTPGQYIARPAPQAAWVPGHWEAGSSGYVWVDGHWAG